MKSVKNRKSQKSSGKSSSSASCYGNSSIVQLFRRQQEKWDAMWGGSSEAPKETNSQGCFPPRVGKETEGGSADFPRSSDFAVSKVNDVDKVTPKKVTETCSNYITSSSPLIAQDQKTMKSSRISDVKLASAITETDRNGRTPGGRLSLKRKRNSSSVRLSSNIESLASLDETHSEALLVPSSLPDGVGFPNSSDSGFVDSVSISSVVSSGPDENSQTASPTTELLEESKNHTDYYLENFSLILNVVMEDDYYLNLFNEFDLAVIDVFRNGLSESARRLYVRLFLRKHKWLRRGKISYSLICEDLKEFLEELTAAGLLYNESHMTSLEETVRCLPAPELRNLAKSLRINPSSKATLSEAIVRHAQHCDVTNFFARSKGSTEKMIMKKAKSMLGECYKLVDDRRSIFIRSMILFGLHNTIGDDDAYGQQLIFQMLMTQIGRIKYPKYKILRKTRIFADRDVVVRYADALQIESELCQALESKDFGRCIELYHRVKESADALLTNPGVLRVDLHLPVHLRSFTPGAIYVRLLTHGVEVLQFVKKYDEAVTQLWQLLNQNVYHREYRGRWYDRLALNLDFHLKRPLEALEVIRSSLADDFVRTGHRFNLLQRAKKICSSASMRKSAPTLWHEFQEDPMNSVKDAPTVTISGRQLYRDVPGGNSVWIGSDSSHPGDAEIKVITRVEEVALRHYAENGYPEGIHGEGSTFRCLFTLFMWDVLFLDDIDDVFYNEYQTHPLDLGSDSFFISRQVEITDRLKSIKSSSNEELCDVVSKVWNEHKDTLCLGINWDLFHNCDHAMGLVRCLGGSTLTGIFDRMARQMRSVTGGVPDLVVWNPDTQRAKIVEVKGPGDRLSSKQILWLDYLLQLGVDAEVCHVRAVGAKTVGSTK